jgi:hypothetical protein
LTHRLSEVANFSTCSAHFALAAILEMRQKERAFQASSPKLPRVSLRTGPFFSGLVRFAAQADANGKGDAQAQGGGLIAVTDPD